MSLQAIANRPQSRQVLRYQADNADALQEVRDFLEGGLVYNPLHLSSDEVCQIPTLSEEGLKSLLERKATSSRWIGWKLWRQSNGWGESEYRSFEQLLGDWKTRSNILRWMRQNEDLCFECGLAERNYDCGDLTTHFYPDSLTGIGVDGPRSAEEFCQLYVTVMNKQRVWHSSKQIPFSPVVNVACFPNYNRLPLWVKQGLVKYAPNHAQIGGDRIGNIWELPTMVKAWKWGNFPKLIAKKIGKLSVKSRLIAGLAWGAVDSDWEKKEKARAEIVNDFWLWFRKLSNSSVIELLGYINSRNDDNYCDCNFLATSKHVRICLEILLDLPYEALAEEWEQGDRDENDFNRPSDERILEIIASSGDPKQTCEMLLGCSGKATVSAFLNCAHWDKVKWAAALAYGSPDSCQKILAQSPQIAYQRDAVEFLLTLPMSARIRLLGCTTFKYRERECEITDDHVRDTGYLWSNIQDKPELGRVRNWFSIHEQLSSAFVEELPDEALPIPHGWEHLDGLSAVDGSWSLEFPRRVATLKHWGKAQKNCVGGYGPAIKQGRSVVFAVREQGLLTHTVEYCGKSCNQFYGYGNGYADTQIELSVKHAIHQAIGA
ncbi:MAG: PcfJ domain-containing protein [Cyanobacteria bacterium P01_F01_bin.150]